MFDDKYMDVADKECEYEIYSTLEKSRDRIEKRTCYVLNEVAYFTNYITEWKGLKKIFAVKFTRMFKYNKKICNINIEEVY